MSAVRDQVLSALAQFQPSAIEVAGATVYVRPITVSGMAKIHAAQSRSPEDVPMLLLLDCVVDEQGVRIFADTDRPKLEAMPGHLAEQILAKIEEVSHMRAKSADTATGN